LEKVLGIKSVVIYYIFLYLFRTGLCGHRTQGNADKFKKPLVIAYYDVDYEKNEKGTNYWRNR
jgi:protein disulfide isomerase family A protein 3